MNFCMAGDILLFLTFTEAFQYITYFFLIVSNNILYKPVFPDSTVQDTGFFKSFHLGYMQLL